MQKEDEGSLRSNASGDMVTKAEYDQAVEDWGRNDERMLAENQRLASRLESATALMAEFERVALQLRVEKRELYYTLKEREYALEQWEATFGKDALPHATAIIEERDSLRADMGIRHGALNGVLGRSGDSSPSDYYAAIEAVADLVNEARRLRRRLAPVSESVPATPQPCGQVHDGKVCTARRVRDTNGCWGHYGPEIDPTAHYACAVDQHVAEQVPCPHCVPIAGRPQPDPSPEARSEASIKAPSSVTSNPTPPSAGEADTTPRSTAAMVHEFHKRFGVQINADATLQLLTLRARLLAEEAREAGEALLEWNMPQIAKELADVVYVAYGAACSLGIDLDEALRLVHASNMSKLDVDGLPICDDDGKVLKGPNYRPPVMTSALPLVQFWSDGKLHRADEVLPNTEQEAEK